MQRVCRIFLIFLGLPALGAPLEPDLSKVPRLILRETNELRKEHGLPALAHHEKLQGAAADFARYIAQTGQLKHDAGGTTPADRARRHGYKWCYVAENLAYRYDTRGFATDDLVRKFMNGWRESAGHRRNLLAREATEIGIAVARSEKTGYYYAVQLFGRPCR